MFPKAWWVMHRGEWVARYAIAPEEMDRQSEFAELNKDNSLGKLVDKDMPYNSLLMGLMESQ